jgi:hypothetical protein
MLELVDLRRKYEENGIMNNAKNPARTSAIIHVAGTLVLSSLIRLANNYISVKLHSGSYRCQRSNDESTVYRGIRDKLQKKLIPRKPHHPPNPRTKMVFQLAHKTATTIDTHFIRTSSTILGMMCPIRFNDLTMSTPPRIPSHLT